MRVTLPVILRCYALLIRLYPRRFRLDFELEMQAVFAAAVADAMHRGWCAVIALLWRELRDSPRRLLEEYWQLWRDYRSGDRDAAPVPAALAAPFSCYRRSTMSLSDESRKVTVARLGHAVVASLPPLILGMGLASALVLVGPHPLAVPRWQLLLGITPAALTALAIVIGGVVAVLRRLPDWGFTWLGAAVMVVLLGIQVLSDELAESGITLPPEAEAIGGAVLIIGALTALGVAARQGWVQASLVSIGMASMMGLAVCFSASAGPIHRHDVAILVAPFGLLMAALSYVYARRPGAARLLSMVSLGCLNAVSVWLTSRVWEDWLLAHGKPSFVLPLLAFLAGALLIGPLVGWLGEMVRRLPARA